MKLGRLTGIAIALLALTVIPNLPQAQAQETAASRITNEEAKTAVDAAEALGVGVRRCDLRHRRGRQQQLQPRRRLARRAERAERGGPPRSWFRLLQCTQLVHGGVHPRP